MRPDRTQAPKVRSLASKDRQAGEQPEGLLRGEGENSWAKPLLQTLDFSPKPTSVKERRRARRFLLFTGANAPAARPDVNSRKPEPALNRGNNTNTLRGKPPRSP